VSERRVLLIVGGGIAAYKSLELIRLLRKASIAVRVVLTRSGAEFVTSLSLAALSEDKVYSELFSLTDESEMGHIQLSRSADLVVVAPATADLMAKTAHGLAPDLASTLLLATDKPVLLAPAMNVRMWEHPATRRNLEILKADGCHIVGPDRGSMACGEFGDGRLAEPEAILSAIQSLLSPGTLSGKHVVITAGPTAEPLDPVRFISNRSSGKQGFALAEALATLGARVTLVAGPVHQPTPRGVERVNVETAREMLAATQSALPADALVCVAAVADWRPANASEIKLKKTITGPPGLDLVENPDILATLSMPGPNRPKLVIGFAAETNDVVEHARAKLQRKGCDWVIANDVTEEGVMGGDHNRVLIVSGAGVEVWDRAPKTEVGSRLAAKIAEALS
jgi:phosphopantothenoylcysteine decarboxylase/phosphopantothenate--cysteine ligase